MGDFDDGCGGGWSPHDGEGKIDICPGPGCDCDEKNYGTYHSKRKDNCVSTFWAIICVAVGFVGSAAVVAISGIDPDDVPLIVYIILWLVIAFVLEEIGAKRGW
jgi:fatty acid desaturase